MSRLAAPVCVLAAFFGLTSAASAAQQVIAAEGGPLTAITLTDALGCNIDRLGQTQVYSEEDGACGTFVATGDTLYGPTVPANRFPVTAYSSPSQTSVTGTGTSGDPFTVVTDVDAGAVHLKQTDTYVAGDDFYTTKVDVSKSTSGSQAVTLYHAFDCFLRGDDEGYGHVSSSSVYCSRGPNDASSGLLGLEPVTAASHHFESDFDSVWGGLDSAGSNFPDTCDCAILQDNGAGINWSFTTAGDGATDSFTFRTRVSADTTNPETSITSGPTGTIGAATAEFEFASNEEGVTFECSVDEPDPTTPCDSPFTTDELSNGPHTFYVRATDHDGNVDATPASRSFIVNVSSGGGGGGGGTGGGGTGTGGGTAGTVGVAPPVAGKSFDAAPASGKIYFKCKGQKRQRLSGALNLPVGCLVDARKGKVRITSAANKDSTKTKSALFYEGQFKVKEKRSSKPVTELALAGKLAGCSRKSATSGKVRDARRRRRRGRRLWGRGRGRFRTRGRRSAASVRGTTWLVEDRCNGSTVTKVRKGKVRVRDFVKHKTVTLKKGQTYVAKPKKKRRR